MKLTLDEKELQIRDEVREFLAGNVLRPDDLPRDLDARVAVLRASGSRTSTTPASSASRGRRSTAVAAARPPSSSWRTWRWRAPVRPN
jgi:hypothetical protein